MGRYMEFVFLDSQGAARLTGVGAIFKNDAETTKAFESCRGHALDVKQARFILELHEDNGDLVDSIPVSIRSFSLISGESFQGEAHYVKYDQNYWAAAWKAHERRSGP